MSTVEKLVEDFKRLPGIGPRQARRFVYFLLSADPRYREEFAKDIRELSNDVTLCTACFRYFTAQKNATPLCRICIDQNRDDSNLMIVEKDIDLENIEKSGAYSGRYFVLGGSIPILEKDPDRRVRSAQLKARLDEEHKKKMLREIILALSNTPDGDNTARYLRELITPYAERQKLTISILGRGLSTGSELEYSDPETIKAAFQNRK